MVTWPADVDWRVRPAALRALSLEAGYSSSGNSAEISEQHPSAVTDLQRSDQLPPVRGSARRRIPVSALMSMGVYT